MSQVQTIKTEIIKLNNDLMEFDLSLEERTCVNSLVYILFMLLELINKN